MSLHSGTTDGERRDCILRRPSLKRFKPHEISGDVRVGELEQERTASTKKNCRLSMDPPGQRGRAEYPFDLSRGMRLNLSKLSVEVLAANYVALHGPSP